MSLKPCRECKREVSSGAATCPHCGVKHPAGPPLAQQIVGAGCFTVIAAIVLAIVIGGRDDGQPRRPPAPQLDHSAPIFIRAGAPLCASIEELDALSRGAPGRCMFVAEDAPVLIMESSGILAPSTRVRRTDANPIVEGWTRRTSLRN